MYANLRHEAAGRGPSLQRGSAVAPWVAVTVYFPVNHTPTQSEIGQAQTGISLSAML